MKHCYNQINNEENRMFAVTLIKNKRLYAIDER